jgi:hypothetical protein
MAFIAGLALFLACTGASLLDFAVAKWQADKNVRIEDAYKWIYQATRGGEHAATDIEMARHWIDAEWKTLDKPEGDEPLWEPLCKDGSIGRLNLRVFKAKGGKADDVLDAFLTGGREFKETDTAFLDAWNLLGERLKKNAWTGLTYAEWLRLDREMSAQKYPAIHHSKTYEDTRRPAYRIITAPGLKRLQSDLANGGSSGRQAPSPRP